METLGLSPAPKTESRWRNLFWPTIRNEVDVDQVGRQGFWICLTITVFQVILGLMIGFNWASGIGIGFFLLGGIGIRQRSRLAACLVFAVYLMGTYLTLLATLSVFGIVQWIFLALLLATVRGAFLSARWRSEATEPPPVRLSYTLTDKIADQMPMHVWPFGQWIFYLLAALETFLYIEVIYILRLR